MPDAPDTSRRRAPDARPQQILEAALEIFGEQGLAGARLDDIARRAGVAKGTIYLYFANKEELFREMVRQTTITQLDERAARLADVAPDQPAVEQLRTYLHDWWAFLCTRESRTVYQLVVGELHRFPDLLQFYLQEVAVRAHVILGDVIARGVARGEFRTVEPRTTARLISSMLASHSLWVGRLAEHPIAALGAIGPDTALAQIEDFALHALRPEPGAASGPAATGGPSA